jgi:hypothetical protein
MYRGRIVRDVVLSRTVRTKLLPAGEIPLPRISPAGRAGGRAMQYAPMRYDPDGDTGFSECPEIRYPARRARGNRTTARSGRLP